MSAMHQLRHQSCGAVMRPIAMLTIWPNTIAMFIAAVQHFGRRRIVALQRHGYTKELPEQSREQHKAVMESIDALQQFWQAEAVFQNLLQSQQRAR